MHIKPFLLLGLLSLVTGCQVITTADGKKSVSILPVSPPKEERYLNTAANAPISEKREAYANQLVSPGQKYATIKTIPYEFFQGLGSLSALPYTVYTIDNKQVKSVKNSLLSPSTNFLSFERSQTKLKLPAGQHDIVFISGIGPSLRYFTEIKNVTLEENKDYVIGVDHPQGSKSLVFIAEYEVDSRFKVTDPESIIITKRIVEGIKNANLKSIKFY